jgi:Co/Zn/Cd efflux system component
MSGCCHTHDAPTTVRLRRILIFVLILNAGIFGVEMVAGLAAKSVSLQSDALDFLGDAATYGITLCVLTMSLRWRAGSALIKGVSMGLFGVFVLAMAVWQAVTGTLPGYQTMGVVGFATLSVNLLCALLLINFREGDSNMRSVWLCSCNDAISNVAFMIAAAGVFASETGWPDIAVAVVMAGLALSSSWQVIRHALAELRDGEPLPANPAALGRPRRRRREWRRYRSRPRGRDPRYRRTGRSGRRPAPSPSVSPPRRASSAPSGGHPLR